MKRIYYSFYIFLLAGLTACSFFSLTSDVDEIAARFHVTATWKAIRNELIKEFKVGMSREEVHKILDKVGPWKMDLTDSPDQGGMDSNTKQLLYRENMHFTQGETLRVLGYWGFLYTENGKLVRTENFDIP